MEFSTVQNRFINRKALGYQLVKGKKGTGKSTISVYRAINLENNYCIYPSDKILIVTKDFSKTNAAMELYQKESEKTSFYSLFSLDKERVEINTIEEIVKAYSNGYKRQIGLNLRYLYQNEGMTVLKKLKDSIDIFSKNSKAIRGCTLEFLLDEINWIKACGFSLEEYQMVDRKGRKNRLLKESYTREALYNLKEQYCNELINNGLMDEWDDVNFASKYAKANNTTFTHIIIDDCDYLTRAEIEFLKGIYSDEGHSSITFIVNTELDNDEKAWLIRGRKLKTLGADFKGKTYLLKNIYEKKIDSIIKFEYLNLKHKGITEFNIDTASSDNELFVDDLIYRENELEEVPVYNDIAAGSPIEINDSVEDTFRLPKQWLERGKDTFILHVKGDSMIDKNINDGDLVVIKKQNVAYNNDIVAASIDGEATLKTLNTNGNKPMLMAANQKYSPILLEDKEVTIIGVAIGVIKENYN